MRKGGRSEHSRTVNTLVNKKKKRQKFYSINGDSTLWERRKEEGFFFGKWLTRVVTK